MRMPQPHRVKRQVLDITVSHLQEEEEITRAVTESYRQNVMALLDEVCSDLVPENTLVSIDTLELDLGTLRYDQIAVDFPRHTRNLFQQALLKELQHQSVSPKGRDQKVEGRGREDPLIHYLQTGLIPWYYEGDLTTLKSEFSNQPLRGLSQVKALFSNRESLRRSVHFFSEEVLEHFVANQLGEEGKGLFRQLKLLRVLLAEAGTFSPSKIARSANELHEKLQAKGALYLEIMIRLIPTIARGNATRTEDLSHLIPEAIRSELQVIFRQRTLRDRVRTSPEKENLVMGILDGERGSPVPDPVAKSNKGESPEKVIANGESISINNAGLILVWPYLQAFFASLELIRDKDFVSSDARIQAIHLLHFLGFGTTEGDETVWLLNKLLCGVGINDFIPEMMKLTDAEQEACDSLLTAVIKNWPALRNTGIESFRNTFFQRSGLLARTENGWVLKVERKSFDVLLDRLPWPISVVKLPWNDYLINTEW